MKLKLQSSQPTLSYRVGAQYRNYKHFLYFRSLKFGISFVCTIFNLLRSLNLGCTSEKLKYKFVFSLNLH